MTSLRRWNFSKVLKQANEKSLWIAKECILCRRARKSKGLRWSRHECSRSSKKATVAEAGTWQEKQRGKWATWGQLLYDIVRTLILILR